MHRILLIDDTPEIADLLTFSLRDRGHEVFAAGYTNAVNELALEHRIDAEVVARGIDALTAINPLQHIGGAVAQTPICHGDFGAVSGFQHQADVERQHAVRAQDLPVTATIQDFAG